MEVEIKAIPFVSNIVLPKRNTNCDFCMVPRLEGTVHCTTCEVCIEGHDHHCMFFGKCIGKGNIICFWGTISGVLVVFFVFAVIFGTQLS